jgi:hypothetical protein
MRGYFHRNANENMTFELLKVCRQANPTWIELQVMYVRSTVTGRHARWAIINQNYCIWKIQLSFFFISLFRFVFIFRLILLRFSFVFFINLPFRKSYRIVLSFRFWALFDYWRKFVGKQTWLELSCS